MRPTDASDAILLPKIEQINLIMYKTPKLFRNNYHLVVRRVTVITIKRIK